MKKGSSNDKPSSKEAQRLEALGNTGLLDSAPEEAFDRLTKLVSKLLKVPVALVSLVDDHRQFFKSAVGLPEPWASRHEIPLSHSFCQHVVIEQKPLVVEDARTDDRVSTNLAIRDLGVIAYLGMPITLASGETIGSLCAIDSKPRDWTDDERDTVSELTHLVVSEIDLRKALQVQLEAMAIVSHDLKNPINALMLSSEMMNRKLDRAVTLEEAKQVIAPGLRRVNSASKRMLELVHEVLDHARVDSGPIPMEFQACKVSDLLHAVVEASAIRAEEKKVKVVMEESVGDLSFSCDQARLEQVLGNVLGNAIEHTPTGKTVSLRAVKKDSILSIVIDDQGPGVPEELRRKIFQKFWRAPGASSSGHGLGLFIATKLVEGHGGTIVAEANSDGGARFKIELPIDGI